MCIREIIWSHTTNNNNNKNTQAQRQPIIPEPGGTEITRSLKITGQPLLSFRKFQVQWQTLFQKNKVKAGKVSHKAKASTARSEESTSMFCSLTCRCVSYDMHSCTRVCIHTHTHKAKDQNVLYISIPTNIWKQDTLQPGIVYFTNAKLVQYLKVN